MGTYTWGEFIVILLFIGVVLYHLITVHKMNIEILYLKEKIEDLKEELEKHQSPTKSKQTISTGAE
jgi:hypothetical protein